MTVVQKGQKGGYVVGNFTGNGHIQLNNSNTSISANSAGETVLSMNITQLLWSTSNGAYFSVSRGANTLLNLVGTSYWDLQEDGLIIDSVGGNPSSNVVITKTGSGPAWAVIKLHKRSSFTSEYNIG